MTERQEKNKFEGSMENVGSVDIGDKITNIYQNAATTIPKELTLSLPKTHPEDIVGRENDLEELHRLLCAEKRVVLVNGLGGIGKTTLAQTYVSKYYDEYAHIAWIAQDSDNIAADFVNTQGLMANLAINQALFEPQQLFTEVIRRLKGIGAKPNLLIIDNAEQSIKQCLDILPSQPDWHLLVTSREEIPKLYRKELGFLSTENAVALFKKHYTHKKLNEEDIKELVTIVDRHTLTVEILAKTAEALRYDGGELKNAITTDLKANVEVAHNRKHPEIDRIASYLGTVFNLSNLSQAETALMKQLACLPAEFHTYELLEELLVDKAGPGAGTFTETLNSLARKGWLLQNKETDSYKMHRIIADITKTQQNISVADIAMLIDAITDKLLIDQSRDNPIDKFTWIPFGNALLAIFGEETSSEITALQNNLALVLQDLGDYQGAKALLEKAAASAEKNFGADHPTTARSYSNLALVLKDLGDYRGAKALLEKAVASDEKNFGVDHPTTATLYSNLALVLQDLGEYRGAKSLLEKAVASDEKNFGVDHPTTAISYSNLAVVLKDLGDYPGAKALLEKAVASAEKNFGVDHPTTAIRYSNLATVLQDLGDYPGAKSLLEKAMASAEKNFGVDHPTTAIRYSNLAMVLYYLGDYPGAKALLEKAVASDEKNFGVDHPNTAIRYSNLAQVLQNLGDYQGAKALLEKAVASAEKNFGADHPTTAISYSNLALVLQGLGDYQGAKALLEKAVASDEKNFGADHPATAIRYHNLSTLLFELGDYNQALTLSDAALAIFKKALPDGHPTIETVNWWNDEIKSKIK